MDCPRFCRGFLDGPEASCAVFLRNLLVFAVRKDVGCRFMVAAGGLALKRLVWRSVVFKRIPGAAKDARGGMSSKEGGVTTWRPKVPGDWQSGSKKAQQGPGRWMGLFFLLPIGQYGFLGTRYFWPKANCCQHDQHHRSVNFSRGLHWMARLGHLRGLSQLNTPKALSNGVRQGARRPKRSLIFVITGHVCAWTRRVSNKEDRLAKPLNSLQTQMKHLQKTTTKIAFGERETLWKHGESRIVGLLLTGARRVGVSRVSCGLRYWTFPMLSVDHMVLQRFWVTWWVCY